MVERFSRDPSVDVDKLQRLLDMREQIVQREREDRFSEAMAAAQAEVRAVTKDARNDQTRSKYATYVQIDRAIRPVYSAHGFSLSFDTQETERENMVRVLCYVRHASGFQQTYSITMPADGKGPRGNDVMTRTHATGSAVSYGMRYLVRMIFNVPETEQDDDGNAAGRRYAPPRPAPNPVYPPHDPETGEIYDPVPPQTRPHDNAAGGAAPVPRSDSTGAADLTVEVVDRQLAEAAKEGIDALRETFRNLPRDWQRIAQAALPRHKAAAAQADAEREAASQMGDR